MKYYNVLWTGGWDSTFMVVYLLVNSSMGGIRPYYILDDDRKSFEYELKAIEKISKKLAEIPFPATLEPLHIIKKGEILPDNKITDAWKRLNNQYGIGSQYDWLSRLAKQESINLCLGIENGPRSLFLKMFKNSGLTIDDNNWQLAYPSNEGSDITTVFKYFQFPIINFTEIKMMDWLKEHNLMNIMNDIWFCHQPINGKPCGMCNPCLEKYGSHMKWLLPSKAQKRAGFLMAIEKIGGTKSRKYISKLIYHFKQLREWLSII